MGLVDIVLEVSGWKTRSIVELHLESVGGACSHLREGLVGQVHRKVEEYSPFLDVVPERDFGHIERVLRPNIHDLAQMLGLFR